MRHNLIFYHNHNCILILNVGPPDHPTVSAQPAIETLQAVLNCLLEPQHPETIENSPETILYTWTKDGKVIGLNNQTTGLLIINNIQQTDAGTYQCSVRNVAGENSADANLTVYCKYITALQFGIIVSFYNLTNIWLEHVSLLYYFIVVAHYYCDYCLFQTHLKELSPLVRSSRAWCIMKEMT